MHHLASAPLNDAGTACVTQLNIFEKAGEPKAAVDKVYCGRETNVLVAWLQRHEFQGGRGAIELLSIGKMSTSAAVAWGSN